MAADGLGSVERVAAEVRNRILDGTFAPADWLREAHLAAELDVSRNTLREGLRLLVAEGLVRQELHRGAVVATLEPERVRDIYRVRRLLESQAISASPVCDDARLDAVEAAVVAVEHAARRKRWRDAGTASLRFHQELVSLLDSPLCDDFFRRVVAQLRLAWSVAKDEEEFQRQWPERDRDLFELVRQGRVPHAQGVLAIYLDDSERLVLATMRAAASR